jgi:hypothetical protein
MVLQSKCYVLLSFMASSMFGPVSAGGMTAVLQLRSRGVPVKRERNMYGVRE